MNGDVYRKKVEIEHDQANKELCGYKYGIIFRPVEGRDKVQFLRVHSPLLQEGDLPSKIMMTSYYGPTSSSVLLDLLNRGEWEKTDLSLSIVTPAPPEETPSDTIMLKVDGKSFRCECGCNCFHKPKPSSEPDLYECNACETRFRGET